MADVKQVTVPDIGDFTDVPVIEVLVGPGDNVAEEDPLVTLESDKATMEIPAPFGGVVEELLIEVGDKVSEGTPVLTLTAQADAGAPTEAAAPGAVDTAVEAEAEAEVDTPDAPEPPAPKAPDEEASSAFTSDDAGPVYASPSVRRLARERGIDLSTIEGTGRKGRITKEDLDSKPEAAPSKAEPAAAPSGGSLGGLELLPWPTVDFEKFGEVERVALSRIKKISAANLARNWVHIPHVTHNDEADVTDLEAFRKQLNSEQSDVKVTMVAMLLKAAAATLKAFPDVNASLDGDELVRKRYYHLGFAADTPNGLVVPVVRDVDSKGLLEVASELTELSGKARAGKLMPADMSGGTFTISSLGGIGGTSFSPIVNAPEVAILGVVRSATKPVWDGSQFVPRLMLPLSLSYDHRVIDGAAAARFVAHLTRVLADLRRVLL
jgi:pyruvate dehydrogenase E2 component (dihydrolipoamide acetyltransferase)